MIIWLWDAIGPARATHGVTGDETRARRAAEACLRSGTAPSARVELAVTVLDTRTLSPGYERTGKGWQARRGPRGGITWEPLAPGEPPARPIPARDARSSMYFSTPE